MTEYGRSPGSQPWDPEDPLYGDPGWHGQQAAGGQSPYGDQAQQYAQQQEPFGQQQYGWDDSQGAGVPYAGGQADPYATGQHPGQPLDPYQAQAAQHGDPYGGQHADYYGTPDGYPAPGPGGPLQGEHPHPPHPGHPGQPGQYPAPGQHPHPGQQQPQHFAPQPQDQHPHSQRPHLQDEHLQQQAAFGQQPGAAAQGRGPANALVDEPVDDWRAEPEPDLAPERPADELFAGGNGPRRGEGGAGGPDDRDGDRRGGPDEGYDDGYEEEYDDDVQESREERRRGRERRNKTKRRSGAACLVVTVVLGGVVAGAGYFGYQFWQEHFGAAPDYAGEGTDEQVQIEIPEGTGVSAMGDILTREGVVKSSRAFVEAANKNPNGDRIQAGSYTLNKQMSGDAAVTMMTDPSALNFLIVSEGMRNRAVYAAIDKKLGAAEGTTMKVAKDEYRNLGLPSWANDDPNIKDPLEGFLYPSRYSVGKDAKPADVLKSMVKQANKEYTKLGIDEAKAQSLGLKSPLDLVTVASLVNAEGMTHDDFRKMADVVYNRLKPDNVQTNGLLEFDSTYNYVKNQSKIDLTIEELRNYDNPYNTYHDEGLPPGPIGNPGEDALKATLEPERGGWYYFISVDLKTTKFTKTYAEHDKLVKEFNRKRRSGN
ncbi:endolytic transglycosylase MltG [Streptomyces sp. 796.1]|uniref:endolytic transglycosylase MltG n=1 Tax=Streptomyces sp. 796.1 TaxID=3163029 RepID=UPI0039C92A9E